MKAAEIRQQFLDFFEKKGLYLLNIK